MKKYKEEQSIETSKILCLITNTEEYIIEYIE